MMFRNYLITHNACPNALNWLGDRSPRQAWQACKHPDWMLWLAGCIDVDSRLIVLCATGCARSVLHLVPASEHRSRQAVKAAEAWAYRRGSARAAWDAAKAAAGAAEAAGWAAASAGEWAACAPAAGAAAAGAAAARAAEWAACAPAAGAAAAGAAAAGAAWWAANAAEAAGIATLAVALRRYARGVRSVIPWRHVADRLWAAGVEVEA